MQVVPVTSKVDRLYPSEAYVTVRGEQRKAMADQLATVSKVRLSGRLGVLSRPDLESVEHAILVQLGDAWQLRAGHAPRLEQGGAGAGRRDAGGA